MSGLRNEKNMNERVTNLPIDQKKIRKDHVFIFLR